MWLRNHVENAIQPVFKKYGSVYYKIVSNWPLIVGTRLKDKVFPAGVRSSKKKSDDTTLLLEVKNPCHGLEVQMMSSTLVDKISLYFGYKVISKIKITIANNDATSDAPSDQNLKFTNEEHDDLSHLQDIIEIINQNKDDEIKSTLINIAKQLKQ